MLCCDPSSSVCSRDECGLRSTFLHTAAAVCACAYIHTRRQTDVYGRTVDVVKLFRKPVVRREGERSSWEGLRPSRVVRGRE